MKIKNKGLKLTIIAVIVLSIFSTATFAINNIATSEKGKVAETKKEDIHNDLSLESKNDFKKLVTAAKAKKQETEEFHKLMEEYGAFIKIYQPTKEEIKYISSLAESGSDLDKLIEIYKFWLDTDEDITLIKQIYDEYSEDYEDDKYWVERVFNKITENAYGKLNIEQIHEYYDKGITRDDIITANRLCRMGKLNIDEILEKRLADTSWVDIVDEIYSKSNRKKNIKIDKAKAEEYKNIKKGTDVLEAAFLSERTDRQIDYYLLKSSNNESLSTERSKYIEERTEGYIKKLKDQNLWDEPQEIKEKNEKARQYLVEKALKNGISQAKIDELKSSGYTELQIYNASAISQKHNIAPEKALESKNKGLSWQDISKEGAE